MTVERAYPPIWRCRDCGQESSKLSNMGCHDNGQKLCSYCRKPLPDGWTRRKYCPGGACAKAVYTICIPQYQRDQVLKRDRGVCSRCGLDTLKLARIVRHVVKHSRLFRGEVLDHLGLTVDSIEWHMDHIKPVVEGGGWRKGIGPEEVMANLRTLCVPCHKEVTAEWHALQAHRRRNPGQLQLDLE